MKHALSFAVVGTLFLGCLGCDAGPASGFADGNKGFDGKMGRVVCRFHAMNGKLIYAIYTKTLFADRDQDAVNKTSTGTSSNGSSPEPLCVRPRAETSGVAWASRCW